MPCADDFQYEDSDAMGIFLTPNQRIWVNTVCRTYMKKPRKQPKRPKVNKNKQ